LSPARRATLLRQHLGVRGLLGMLLWLSLRRLLGPLGWRLAAVRTCTVVGRTGALGIRGWRRGVLRRFYSIYISDTGSSINPQLARICQLHTLGGRRCVKPLRVMLAVPRPGSRIALGDLWSGRILVV
jgi:hypothetical protein